MTAFAVFYCIICSTAVKGLNLFPFTHLRRLTSIPSREIKVEPAPRKKYGLDSWRYSKVEKDSNNDGIAHDEVTYRLRSGGTFSTFIPQAERYSSKDWIHNLMTIPTSRLLKRIRQVILFNLVWSVIVYLAYLMFQFKCPG